MQQEVANQYPTDENTVNPYNSGQDFVIQHTTEHVSFIDHSNDSRENDGKNYISKLGNNMSKKKKDYSMSMNIFYKILNVVFQYFFEKINVKKY